VPAARLRVPNCHPVLSKISPPNRGLSQSLIIRWATMFVNEFRRNSRDFLTILPVSSQRDLFTMGEFHLACPTYCQGVDPLNRLARIDSAKAPQTHRKTGDCFFMTLMHSSVKISVSTLGGSSLKDIEC
jgi:hypothetical protein